MMSKVKVIFAVIGLFALLGCAGSPVGDLIAGPEKLAQQDDAYCKSIGLSFGTQDYANCRMLQDANRESRHAQANALSDSLLAAGATVAAYLVLAAALVEYLGAEQSTQTDEDFGVAVETLYRFE
jgi:hypothetical protein